MGVFQDVQYYLANSLPPHRQEQLEYALSKNGARKADITTATHIITNSPYFEGCEDVENGPAIVSVRDSMSFPRYRLKILTHRTIGLTGRSYLERCNRACFTVHSTPTLPDTSAKTRSQYYSVDPAMVFSGIVACASDVTHKLFLNPATCTRTHLGVCLRSFQRPTSKCSRRASPLWVVNGVLVSPTTLLTFSRSVQTRKSTKLHSPIVNRQESKSSCPIGLMTRSDSDYVTCLYTLMLGRIRHI